MADTTEIEGAMAEAFNKGFTHYRNAIAAANKGQRTQALQRIADALMFCGVAALFAKRLRRKTEVKLVEDFRLSLVNTLGEIADGAEHVMMPEAYRKHATSVDGLFGLGCACAPGIGCACDD